MLKAQYVVFMNILMFILGCADDRPSHSDQIDGISLASISADQSPPNWGAQSELSSQQLGVSSVRLAWGTPEDESQLQRYLVYQDQVLIATLESDVVTLRVGSLMVNQSYQFQIQAEDIWGNQSTQGPELAVTLTDLEPPSFGHTARLTAEQAGHDQALLQWTEAQDNLEVSAYEIYQNQILIETVSSDIQEFTAEGLIADEIYAFRVVALDTHQQRSLNGLSVHFILRDQIAPEWCHRIFHPDQHRN